MGGSGAKESLGLKLAELDAEKLPDAENLPKVEDSDTSDSQDQETEKGD